MLLWFSVLIIIERYDLFEGSLLIDDTGRARCKRTRKIGKAHKIRAKKTSGYINGQELVFLGMQMPLVTIPVDFRFYMPDPDVSQWRNSEISREAGCSFTTKTQTPKAQQRLSNQTGTGVNYDSGLS